jgi:hypothetical protein
MTVSAPEKAGLTDRTNAREMPIAAAKTIDDPTDHGARTHRVARMLARMTGNTPTGSMRCENGYMRLKRDFEAKTSEKKRKI